VNHSEMAKLVFVFLSVLTLSSCSAEKKDSVSNQTLPQQPIRIVLVGDSTVTEHAGWGLGFRQFLNDRAKYFNTAAGGRSSKSFINEGKWDEAMALKGDYYLIQFGHNDEPGKGERSTDPKTTYLDYMTRYIEDSRAIGAEPILITSLVRRQWDKSGNGKINSSLVPYVQAVKKLAKEKNVKLVDLHQSSKELCESFGKEKCWEFSPIKDTNQIDNTHLNPQGSTIFARLVIEELIKVAPELSVCFQIEPNAEPELQTSDDLWRQVPQNGSSDIIADNIVLSWQPHSSSCVYGVYIGKEPDRITLAAKVKNTAYTVKFLDTYTDYYWQIRAYPAADSSRVLAESSVSRFKTAQKAFPSAEGFGKYAIGGRGGKVIKVTNLNDRGPGSFREAINTKGPRIIVFDVSGNIMIKSPLEIREPFVTIAGQTAPGGGIAVIGHETSLLSHDVILRHMRFRATDLSDAAIDAFNNGSPADKSTRFIIDHCSFSWGIDETLSICSDSVCTVQWCLVSESLVDSVHRKGPHGYGGIWGGAAASFHHNLLAHHSSRNPRFDVGRGGRRCLIDYRNNVVYNWLFNSAYGAEDDMVNMINNYYKAGPATKKDCANRIFQAIDSNTRMYIHGNYVSGFPQITKDNWTGGVHFDRKGTATEKTLRSDKPFDVVTIPTTSAEEAYHDVLAKVGAVRPTRDSLDQRIITELQTGTAKYGVRENGIIDSQFDLCPQQGKCQKCIELDYCWLPVLKSDEILLDSDGDAMPDEWEISRGLNPYDALDANYDRNNDGYTNIEEYLNELAGDTF